MDAPEPAEHWGLRAGTDLTPLRTIGASSRTRITPSRASPLPAPEPQALPVGFVTRWEPASARGAGGNLLPRALPPGELGRGSEEPSASPASAAVPQRGIFVLPPARSSPAPELSGPSGRRQPAPLPAGAAFAKKIMAVLNDFITVNCRSCSVNTGGATHLAFNCARASRSHAPRRREGSGMRPLPLRCTGFPWGLQTPSARGDTGTQPGHPGG